MSARQRVSCSMHALGVRSVCSPQDAQPHLQIGPAHQQCMMLRKQEAISLRLTLFTATSRPAAAVLHPSVLLSWLQRSAWRLLSVARWRRRSGASSRWEHHGTMAFWLEHGAYHDSPPGSDASG